jgi:GNAT superfamily N-acetyltransferase
MSQFNFKEVSSELWPDFEKLFGRNGACGGCWCQWHRLPKGGKLWESTKGAKAKIMMKALFDNNTITGLLAYDGDIPAGWCSYGPRVDFPMIDKMKAYGRDDLYDPDRLWCINCFFIDKSYRHKGLARKILKAAVRFMKKRNVSIIEAYPVPLTKDGHKLPASFVWRGPLKLFEEEGFELVQRHSHSRPLMQMEL